MGRKPVSRTDRILRIVDKSGLTPKELSTYLSTQDKPHRRVSIYKDHLGKRFKFGVFGDAHIGQKEFDESFFKHMGQVFKKEKIKRAYQVGDILEGMSGRHGQIYELTQIGFSQQINYAAELYNKYLGGIDILGIDGNHDAWYKKKNNGGVIVGEELEKRVSTYHHLGEMEADVEIAPGITMKLFHPNDGTAYATSYKLQKLVESFEGGKKPNIVLEGHYHKALYMFSRNIHAMECGTLCGQTEWMRGKKIQAHKGFWIVEVEVGKRGIGKFNPTFYPNYD